MTNSAEYRDAQYSRMLIVLGLFIAGGTAIAVGAVFGPTVRSVTFLLGALVVALAARRNRLDVLVDAAGIRLGDAHVGWEHIGRVEVLDAVGMRAAITTGAHPSDYLRVRDTKAGMRAWLADPSDPHRCWVASIARPSELSAVLAGREEVAARAS